MSEVTKATQEPRPIVAVILGHPVPDLESLASSHRTEHLHVIGPLDVPQHIRVPSAPPVSLWKAETLGEMNWCLTMLGSPAVIHQRTRLGAEDHWTTCERLFLHLEHDGRYVIRAEDFTDPEEFRTFAARVTREFARHLEDPGQIDASSAVRYLGGIDVGPRRIELRKRSTHLLVHRDERVNRILGSRLKTSSCREISRLPALTFPVRGSVSHHGATIHHKGFEPVFEIPEQRVRLYEGDVRMVGRCLATIENSVIPESFRFHHEKTLRNPLLHRIKHEFAEVTGDTNFNDFSLQGNYYHVDCSNPGHFGHLMTEVVAKLWGWHAAKKEFPDLKLLFRIRRPGERFPELELQLFEAFGVRRGDVHWVGEPVRLNRLVAASPQWHQQFPHFVDPRIEETWDRLSASLVDPEAPRGERVFVSRLVTTTQNRVCRNTPEVEDVFRSFGFEVVHPERLSLGEQASVFAGARVIAGFAGSALFNLLHSQRLDRLIVLTHESYTARNEYMFSAVKGFHVDYVWHEPDIPQPEGGWSEEAYFSSWDADIPRLRKTAKALLRH